MFSWFGPSAFSSADDGKTVQWLFVCCKTIENHFPISLDEAETTEHERFSTAAARSCWLMTSCSACWWMTALWGDGTCHWQMMMHSNGCSYRLAQADVFNNLMSEVDVMETSSFQLFVSWSFLRNVQKDDSKKNFCFAILVNFLDN